MLEQIDYIDIHTHHFREEGNILSQLNFFPSQDAVAGENHKYSIGLHPWHINEQTLQEDYQTVQANISNKNCMAIGEIGLDRAIEKPLDIQKEIFIKQLEIAEEHKKPVIIHCVKAYSDILQLYNEFQPTVPWVLHGYYGNRQMAEKMISKNIYLSFGHYLFKCSPKVVDAFKTLPLYNIFLETDESAVTIEEIYHLASMLRGTDPESFREELKENYKKVFLQDGVI